MMGKAAGQTHIDGWPVTEPRLMARGCLLRMGAVQLRFDGRDAP